MSDKKSLHNNSGENDIQSKSIICNLENVSCEVNVYNAILYHARGLESVFTRIGNAVVVYPSIEPIRELISCCGWCGRRILATACSSAVLARSARGLSTFSASLVAPPDEAETSSQQPRHFNVLLQGAAVEQRYSLQACVDQLPIGTLILKLG